MEAIRILSNEHENILIAINFLNKECNALNEGKKLDSKFFIKIIDFIRSYADKLHHAKEEDLLFKELCGDSVNLHCNPTQQMLHEHELGRNFVKGIEEGIKKNNITEIIENSKNYAQLLQEHIFKEDNILYPMADEALDKKTKDAMLKKFLDIDRKKQKVIKKQLAFIKRLKNEEK